MSYTHKPFAIHGSAAAIITPMDETGRIDPDAFEALIDWQIKSGTTALIVGGTTGEGATLRKQEMSCIFHLAVEAAQGRVPIVAGIGAITPDDSIDLAHLAMDAGVNGLLAVTPYYVRPDDIGMYRHFSAIHDATDLPIILYDVPARTGTTISESVLEKLADKNRFPRITGLKDCTNDMARIARMSSLFNVLSGNDDTALEAREYGAHGCISVTANIAPDRLAAMHASFDAGNITAARQQNNALMPLHTAMFCISSPIAVKYAASRLGFGHNIIRAPLSPADDLTQAKIDRAMNRLGIIGSGPKTPTPLTPKGAKHLRVA